MNLRLGGWGLLAATLLMALATKTPFALATEQVLFGPAQYTRTAGPPNQFMEAIAVPPTLTAPFRLHVETGNAERADLISSATITLNGVQVAGPADFSPPLAAFDKTVALQANNTLQVRLTSLPGRFLLLTLYGTVPPPALTKLEPPSLPITAGGTGTLTATISTAQTTPTTIALSSDTPAVAAVPATAIVPAYQLAVVIPVTAVAPGNAAITATLNGSTAHSTVTVAPAGPTITSLTPATLHVTQGASGTLTVTISAAQATDTVVALATSDARLVGLPPAGTVTVPARQTSQSFPVFGVAPGAATTTASLNGTAAQSQVTVVVPLPTVVGLLPPVLSLSEGSSGTLTVTLNATQPTDTAVALTTSDPTIVGLPASGTGLPPGNTVTVPAQALSASFPVTGLTRGTASVTASLHGTSATAAIEVQPPPPTMQGLACPATLTTGATTLCAVTLNATQFAGTVVPLSSSAPDIASVPSSVTVPADTLTAQFSVTAVAVGSATLTAGPLNGTSQTVTVQAVPPPPTVVSLLPVTATLFVGATANLTLTLNAAQPGDTSVPLASSAPGVASVPPRVTVPAGSLTTTLVVIGFSPGGATIIAGPLNGTQVQSSIAVTQLPPTILALAPALSLPKGRAGTLTATIAPTQPDPAIVPLSSSDPSVGVPTSVTIPAGASTAPFPVLANAVGGATITAGPLNGTSQTATVTVTPAELVALAVAPSAPAIAKGQTQQFTATGSYTDGTTQDLTGTAAWNSSDPSVGTITSPGGLAAALMVGQSTITAAVGSVSATATLTVTPPILASLAVNPANPTRTVGQTLQFQARGTFTDGSSQDLTAAVTWVSSDPAVASITSPGGLAAALARGATTITATHLDGFTASTTLTVILLPPTITGFSPTSGRVGDQVTIAGTDFLNVQAVSFNGISAPSFTVQSPTSILATIPPGATSGPLVVVTAAGAATSGIPFTVLIPPTVSIASPSDGATITTGRVLVRGTVSGATGEIGVLVNGGLAQVTNGQWAMELPLVEGTNSITVTATDALGTTGTARIAVQVLQATQPPLRLTAILNGGVAPLAVRFAVVNQTGRPLVRFELDVDGDGTVDVTATSFEDVPATYPSAGIFFPALKATDDQGTTYTATTILTVLDAGALDAGLKARWAGLKAALGAGDTTAALAQIVQRARAGYADLFATLGPSLSSLGADMPAIQPVYLEGTFAKYRLRRTQMVGGTVMTITHYIYFSLDEDGLWRIESF